MSESGWAGLKEDQVGEMVILGLNCENAGKKQARRLFYPGFVRST